LEPIDANDEEFVAALFQHFRLHKETRSFADAVSQYSWVIYEPQLLATR
jgi:hypothetical protein